MAVRARFEYDVDSSDAGGTPAFQAEVRSACRWNPVWLLIVPVRPGPGDRFRAAPDKDYRRCQVVEVLAEWTRTSFAN